MIPQLLVLLFGLITFLFLSVDTFGSFDSSIRHLGISSTFVFICFLLLLISLAFFNRYYFPQWFLFWNKRLITPLFSVLSVLFVVIHYLTYNTFILRYFHIQIENFIVLALFFGSISYISHSKKQTLAQKMVYFFGPILFIGFIFLDYFSEFLFKRLRVEDGLLENSQFLFYLISGLINGWLGIHFYRKKQYVNVLIFLGLSFMLLMVSGEEISWGQRIFGIATPEVIRASNFQGEMNIHNEGFIQRYIHFFYMGLGLFCSLSGVVLLRFYHKVRDYYHILIPSTLTFFYFFAIFVYYFLNQYLVFYYKIFSAERIGLGKWQEVAEFFLATGFLIFAISSYKKVRKQSTFLNKPKLEDNPIL